jgi:hypothetical protein
MKRELGWSAGVGAVGRGGTEETMGTVYRIVNAVIRKEAPISSAIHGRTPSQSAIQLVQSHGRAAGTADNRVPPNPTGQRSVTDSMRAKCDRNRATDTQPLPSVHVCDSHSTVPVSNPDMGIY